MYNGFEREDGVALIKRKQTSEDVALRCPHSHEQLPEGARQCTMCGHSLADVATGAARERVSEPQER